MRPLLYNMSSCKGLKLSVDFLKGKGYGSYGGKGRSKKRGTKAEHKGGEQVTIGDAREGAGKEEGVAFEKIRHKGSHSHFFISSTRLDCTSWDTVS
jgi:hypothetical protein